MSELRCYFNGMAGSWDEMIGEETRERMQRMIKDLQVRPGSEVLDVGSGTGIIIPCLVEAVGEEGRVTAIDIAEEMLEAARNKLDYPNVDYLQADIANTPFEDAAFEEVICNCCFPHVAEKERAAREMFRILRSGGRAVICHPRSREAINEIHRGIGGVVGRDMLPDGPEMSRIFSRAGFEDISVVNDEEGYLLQAFKRG